MAAPYMGNLLPSNYHVFPVLK